jgi:hypothetical protein
MFMQGWQVAIIIIGIGLSQIGFSFYFRQKEMAGKYRSKRSTWKLLLITALLVILEGIILLILPENLWWTY